MPLRIRQLTILAHFITTHLSLIGLMNTTKDTYGNSYLRRISQSCCIFIVVIFISILLLLLLLLLVLVLSIAVGYASNSLICWTLSYGIAIICSFWCGAIRKSRSCKIQSIVIGLCWRKRYKPSTRKCCCNATKATFGSSRIAVYKLST